MEKYGEENKCPTCQKTNGMKPETIKIATKFEHSIEHIRRCTCGYSFSEGKETLPPITESTSQSTS